MVMWTGAVGCSLALLGCCVPTKCLLVLEVGILGFVGGRRVRDEVGSERKGKLQQVSCYGAGDDTGTRVYLGSSSTDVALREEGH